MNAEHHWLDLPLRLLLTLLTALLLLLLTLLLQLEHYYPLGPS